MLQRHRQTGEDRASRTHGCRVKTRRQTQLQTATISGDASLCDNGLQMPGENIRKSDLVGLKTSSEGKITCSVCLYTVIEGKMIESNIDSA